MHEKDSKEAGPVSESLQRRKWTVGWAEEARLSGNGMDLSAPFFPLAVREGILGVHGERTPACPGWLGLSRASWRPLRGGRAFRGLQGVHGGSGTFPVSVFFMALRSILRFAGVHGPVAGPPISPCFVLRFAKGDAARFERERGAGHSPAWATKLGPLPGGPFPRQRLLRVCFSGLLSGV